MPASFATARHIKSFIDELSVSGKLMRQAGSVVELDNKQLIVVTRWSRA